MTAPRIVAAAIKIKTKVHQADLPARHCDLLRVHGHEGASEGFVDDAGGFHDRAAAASIALAAGQIAQLRDPALLYTCDLSVGKKVR